MKKLAILVFSFFLIGITVKASISTLAESENFTYNPYDNQTYIFEEGGVEFSVFSDGQFDFVYVGLIQSNQVILNTPNVNISFNSGYDYEMFVQYDDYGAIIQVENVPVYYDSYGRITQAGNVNIQYNDRRIIRVGGLSINYDYYGYYRGSTGYINIYNQFYVYRPWHIYYIRPVYTSCIVYDYPYRQYYNPIRFSYHDHSNYYKNRYNVPYGNGRKDFHRPGSRTHYRDGRNFINKDYKPNHRNTMVAEYGRSKNSTTENRYSRIEKPRKSINSSSIDKREGINEAKNERPTTTRNIGRIDRSTVTNNKNNVNRTEQMRDNASNNKSEKSVNRTEKSVTHRANSREGRGQ